MSTQQPEYRDPMSRAAVRQLVWLGVAGTGGFIALMVALAWASSVTGGGAAAGRAFDLLQAKGRDRITFRQGIEPDASARGDGLDAEPQDLVRLRIGQGPEQDRMDDGEDGGRRAKPEHEGQEGGGRECGPPRQLAKGLAGVPAGIEEPR